MGGKRRQRRKPLWQELGRSSYPQAPTLLSPGMYPALAGRQQPKTHRYFQFSKHKVSNTRTAEPIPLPGMVKNLNSNKSTFLVCSLLLVMR
jgi:hypothetical protein